MTSTRQRNYLNNVLKNVDKRRRQVIVMKSNATKSFKAGKISEADKQRIHNQSDKNRKEINDYVKHYKLKLKSFKGSGTQQGKGAYFLMIPSNCLKN